MASNKFTQHAGSLGGKPLSPNYSFIFDFEENFDVKKSMQWFNDNPHIPFIFGIFIYLPVLYFGQKLMANREAMKLRIPLILWNTSLAIFSIVGFCRIFPEFVYSWQHFGFYHTICNSSHMQVKPAAFWTYLFVLSKTPELVDTIFLVLKKQRLIFLHVYHHATVLIFAWFIYAHEIAAARWFCTMNFGVHSIMYTYYALKAMPEFIRIPKWISMLITTSQTLQMMAGSYVVALAFHAHLKGQPCKTDLTMSISGLVIYVSYLVLFSHFFYKAYCSPSPIKARDTNGLGKKKV